MTTWFTGDSHFGHEKIIEYEKENRPFASIEEHDEALIERWNSVVQPQDLVWHLGDVVFGDKVKNLVRVLPRLKGRKRLIMGNHDTPSLIAAYLEYFEAIGGAVFLPVKGDKKILLTHIPVHPCQLEHRAVANVHGHMHSNFLDDPRYINVSVECWQLKPVSFEQVMALIPTSTAS